MPKKARFGFKNNSTEFEMSFIGLLIVLIKNKSGNMMFEISEVYIICFK